MTEEQIKQKAEAEADKVIIGSGMDRASVIHLKHLLTTLYVQGYLAGAEPREKQIAELEATCNKWFEHLKNREEELLNELNNQNAKYNKQIEELEKENAELQHKIDTLQGFLDRDVEFDNLQKENADLKEEINKIAFARGNLEEENAELKEKVNILDNCDRLGDVITEAYKEQLTKAKEIIKIFLKYEICTLNIKEELADNIAKAEQFISEVEK